MRIQSLFVGVGLAASAAAQLPDVAICAAANTNLGDCRYTDVQAFLSASGQFGSVDIVDCTSTTPLLSDLTPYDCVITWSNTNYNDVVLLGDVFADYSDQGGGVVVAVFGTNSTNANRSLDGRWRSGGYELIQTQGGNAGGSASLGTINSPSHPTVAGVNSLSASNAFRPPATIPILQGNVIAEWNDGSPLIVTDSPIPGRVDLGLYPPSSNCSASFWDTGTDGAAVLVNACAYAAATAAGSSIGTSFCVPNNNSTGGPGSLTALGSTAVVDNSLTLLVGGLPASQFGIIVVSDVVQPPVMPPNSQGVLCLGGQIGRYSLPGEIFQVNGAGATTYGIDLTAIRRPNTNVAAVPGDTWYFQAWHRDVSPGGPTSNFTEGVEVSFN